jgi:hypothetical protein
VFEDKRASRTKRNERHRKEENKIRNGGNGEKLKGKEEKRSVR